ncbi:flagellar protein FlgN [Candidatus Sumerlaeota bacterium]|nr:flagellar protein FlgN [Candidatus Sumerlaeota bacterium]
MEKHLQQLETSLIEQIRAHTALAALLDEERTALVGVSLDSIHSCARRKVELAQAIQSAEQLRLQAMEALCQGLGLAPQPMRLADLIDLLPLEQRPRLEELRERLVIALRAARDSQERNRSLAERFLSVVSSSMEAIQRAVATLPLYTPSAKVGNAPWRGCVVSQQA